MAALKDFAKTRRGVEAYLEPATTTTQTSVVLVARDGEWTRRRVTSAKTAASLAKGLSIPLYDVNRVGYPQRMRDYNARIAGERQRPQSRATTSAPSTPESRFGPAERDAIAVLQDVSGSRLADADLSDDDLRRLVRLARAKAHPDRREGRRDLWDKVERASRTLGMD